MDGHGRGENPRDGGGGAVRFACGYCRMLFPSADALDNHERRFCRGSEMQQRLIRKTQEAGLLDADDVRTYLSGGAAPKGASGLESMSVEQLRERLARDAKVAEVRLYYSNTHNQYTTTTTTTTPTTTTATTILLYYYYTTIALP